MYLKLSTEGEFARNKKILCAWRRHGENASDDLPAMYDEMIASQDKLAGEMRMPRERLDQIQAEFKFRAASNLLRHGFRQEASRWFLENIRGAGSVGEVAGTAARLAIPQTLFQWNRRREERRAFDRSATINDVMKSSDDV
jgi:hypothetical protein